jgi:excinuclease UvrABC nuclease subunit
MDARTSEVSLMNSEHEVNTEEIGSAVDALRRAIALLSGESVRSATMQLQSAVKGGDLEQTAHDAKRLRDELELVADVVETADKMDPHTVDKTAFKKLWRLRPKKLVANALEEGKMRERRMILQAKEAQTNQLLAAAAFLAAIVALVVPYLGPACN